jgi:hypothetical protein
MIVKKVPVNYGLDEGMTLCPQSPGERSLLEHLSAQLQSRSTPEWSSVQIRMTDGSVVQGQDAGLVGSSTPEHSEHGKER